MKIIVDTNRIIAALIKDSISRKILFNKNFEFISPDITITEITKYEEEILEKAKINKEELGILLPLIFENIEIIPKEKYENFLERAENLIKEDIEDAPFIALCLALKAEGIWSDDPHFLEQDKIKIFKTKDIMELI